LRQGSAAAGQPASRRHALQKLTSLRIHRKRRDLAGNVVIETSVSTKQHKSTPEIKKADTRPAFGFGKTVDQFKPAM
jgi:hypothetical protein